MGKADLPITGNDVYAIRTMLHLTADDMVFDFGLSDKAELVRIESNYEPVPDNVARTLKELSKLFLAALEEAVSFYREKLGGDDDVLVVKYYRQLHIFEREIDNTSLLSWRFHQALTCQLAIYPFISLSDTAPEPDADCPLRSCVLANTVLQTEMGDSNTELTESYLH